MESSSSQTSSSKSATPFANVVAPPPPRRPTSATAPQSIDDVLSTANPAMLSLLKKVRTVQDSLANLRQVNGRPGRCYVWVMNHPTRTVYFEGLGYTVTKSKMIDGLPAEGEVTTRWVQSDGRHISGDLILYDIAEDMHQLIKFEPQYRALQRLDGGVEEFKALASQHGFEITEGERG